MRPTPENITLFARDRNKFIAASRGYWRRPEPAVYGFLGAIVHKDADWSRCNVATLPGVRNVATTPKMAVLQCKSFKALWKPEAVTLFLLFHPDNTIREAIVYYRDIKQIKSSWPISLSCYTGPRSYSQLKGESTFGKVDIGDGELLIVEVDWKREKME
jgi:hypothetical protein